MKMKRLTFAFLAVFLTLTVCSVKAEEKVYFPKSAPVSDNENGVIKETLDLKDFLGVICYSNVEVYYTQGDKYKVVLHAGNDTSDMAVITVEDGVVNVDVKRKCDKNAKNDISEPLKLFITSPSHDKNSNINLSGACLNLDCSDLGNLDINLDCKSVYIDKSGVLHMTFSGETDNVDL